MATGLVVGGGMPAAAAQAGVRDLDGNERRLRELWALGPVVLVFLRHFG